MATFTLHRTADSRAQMDKIIRVLPKERTTFMFSATMSEKARRQSDIVLYPCTHAGGPAATRLAA